MKASLRNIRDIIIKPRVAFTHIRDDRKWFFILLLGCIGSAIIMWAIAPFEAHIASYNTGEKKENVNRTVTPEDYHSEVTTARKEKEENVSYVISDLITEIIKAFVGIPILMAIVSLCFLAVARLFRVKRTLLKFRHIYATFVHVILIGVFVSGINTILLLIFKRPQDIQTASDMQMLPGLHHLGSFLKNEKLLTFLSDFNLLGLWEIALLTIAVEVLTGASRSRSILAGTLIWLIPTGLEAIL